MLAALVNTITLFFFFSLTVGITVLVITDAVKFNWVLNVPFVGRYKIQLKKTRGSFSFQMGKASRWVQKAKKKQVEIPVKVDATPESCDPYALSNRFFADDLTENLDTSEHANKRWVGAENDTLAEVKVPVDTSQNNIATICNRSVCDEKTIADIDVVECDSDIIDNLSLSTSADAKPEMPKKEGLKEALEACKNENWEEDYTSSHVQSIEGEVYKFEHPLSPEQQNVFRESLEAARNAQKNKASIIVMDEEDDSDESSVELSCLDGEPWYLSQELEIPETPGMGSVIEATPLDPNEFDTQEFEKVMAYHNQEKPKK